MKTIIITMAAIAATITMASCNKEQPVSPNEDPTVGKSVITASIDNNLTKTALKDNDNDGYKVVWSKGDDLFVADVNEEGEFNSWIAQYTLEESCVGSCYGTFGWQAGDFFMNINEDSPKEGPAFVAGNMYMALYPFDLIDLGTGAYTWKTEQTYCGTAGYIPMVGAAECTKDGTADFMFANLGGLLRLTVKGTAAVSSITVQANEPMSGEIAAIIDDDEGQMVALMLDKTEYGAFDTKNMVRLDCGDGVELSSEGTDFFISMPCHYSIEGTDMVLKGYSGVSVTLMDTKGNTCVKNLKNENGLVIERSKITTATFTASEFEGNALTGALSGVFSVSDTKKVQFSKGNLWADGDNALHLEASQNAFNSIYEPDHVSHFTWCDNIAGAVGTSIDGSNLFCDENHKVSVDGSDAIYYVLSTEEWYYLFSKHSKKWVTVNGVNGYVIAPDGVTLSDVTTYSEDELKEGNLVFLPAAGYRYGSDFYLLDNRGRYWSSTASDGGFAYCVYFDSDHVSPSNDGVREDGYCVRLVTDVK